MNCYWQGTQVPRALRNRHTNDCTDEECRGCLDCPMTHCMICGISHVDQQTCPECIAAVRDHLVDLQQLVLQLPEQALNGGNDGKLEAAREIPGGEAMVMMAPGSDARAVAWAAERGDDVSHRLDELPGDVALPELAMVTWEDDWRIVRGHRTERLASLGDAVAYLDENLSWAAQEHLAFDEFARELRQQVARLEDVLHAGERPETGVPCVQCERVLVKRYGDAIDGSGDTWYCPGCREEASDGSYWQSVRRDYLRHADKLTADDMAVQYRIKPRTLTAWAARGHVRKHGLDDYGRQLYSVSDVLERCDENAA